MISPFALEGKEEGKLQPPLEGEARLVDGGSMVQASQGTEADSKTRREPQGEIDLESWAPGEGDKGLALGFVLEGEAQVKLKTDKELEGGRAEIKGERPSHFRGQEETGQLEGALEGRARLSQ